MERFKSEFSLCGNIDMPAFSNTRIMMMPFILGDVSSLPTTLFHYFDLVKSACGFRPQHHGKTGYLTIDEKWLREGQSTRRPGLHVDGVYRGGNGGWGGGCFGAVGNGMLTVASAPGCMAWNQEFVGWPGDEGDCEHLRSQCGDGTLFGSGDLYWVDGLCVHESLRMADKPTPRQFVRISLPSDGPWFEGYTVNPLGILPSGPILPERTKFMNM